MLLKDKLGLSAFGGDDSPPKLGTIDAQNLCAGAWWYEGQHALRANKEPDAMPTENAAKLYTATLQLALYFEAQIDLFSEMCVGRSYNNIFELEQQSFPSSCLSHA